MSQKKAVSLFALVWIVLVACGCARPERSGAGEATTPVAEPLVSVDVAATPVPFWGIAGATARERTGVGDGPCTYFPARQAWILEADGATHIVTPAGKEKHAGQLVLLFDALTAREPVEVTLFDGAAAEDPHGHVAFLAGRGFKARSAEQKGGTYRGVVEVRSSEVAALLTRRARLGDRRTPGPADEPVRPAETASG